MRLFRGTVVTMMPIEEDAMKLQSKCSEGWKSDMRVVSDMRVMSDLRVVSEE